MSESNHVVMFSTAGSLEEAGRIARYLVESHLVACVNLIPSIQSIYWWNDALQQEHEVMMILKTTRSRIEEVKKSISSMHSYQTPEILAVNIEDGLKDYLDWITRSTAGEQS